MVEQCRHTLLTNVDWEKRLLTITSLQFRLHFALMGTVACDQKNKDASKYYGNTKLSSSAIRPHIESIFQWWDIWRQRGRENLTYFPRTLTVRLKIAPMPEDVLSLHTSNALSKSHTVFICIVSRPPHIATHVSHSLALVSTRCPHD
jgi:hypothetical protein